MELGACGTSADCPRNYFCGQDICVPCPLVCIYNGISLLSEVCRHLCPDFDPRDYILPTLQPSVVNATDAYTRPTTTASSVVKIVENIVKIVDNNAECLSWIWIVFYTVLVLSVGVALGYLGGYFRGSKGKIKYPENVYHTIPDKNAPNHVSRLPKRASQSSLHMHHEEEGSKLLQAEKSRDDENMRLVDAVKNTIGQCKCRTTVFGSQDIEQLKDSNHYAHEDIDGSFRRSRSTSAIIRYSNEDYPDDRLNPAAVNLLHKLTEEPFSDKTHTSPEKAIPPDIGQNLPHPNSNQVKITRTEQGPCQHGQTHPDESSEFGGFQSIGAAPDLEAIPINDESQLPPVDDRTEDLNIAFGSFTGKGSLNDQATELLLPPVDDTAEDRNIALGSLTGKGSLNDQASELLLPPVNDTAEDRNIALGSFTGKGSLNNQATEMLLSPVDDRAEDPNIACGFFTGKGSLTDQASAFAKNQQKDNSLNPVLALGSIDEKQTPRKKGSKDDTNAESRNIPATVENNASIEESLKSNSQVSNP